MSTHQTMVSGATATVTNVSGATAIVSASTSKVVSMGSPETIDMMREVMTTADIIGVCSFVVLALSFLWNVYSTRRKNKIELMNYELEREKFELMKIYHDSK